MTGLVNSRLLPIELIARVLATRTHQISPSHRRACASSSAASVAFLMLFQRSKSFCIHKVAASYHDALPMRRQPRDSSSSDTSELANECRPFVLSNRFEDLVFDFLISSFCSLLCVTLSFICCLLIFSVPIV